MSVAILDDQYENCGLQSVFLLPDSPPPIAPIFNDPLYDNNPTLSETFSEPNCVTVAADGVGGDLTYSIDEVDPPEAEDYFDIDPSTGVITCDNSGDEHNYIAVG